MATPPFGKTSSMEVLKWVSQYKKLLDRPSELLTPKEKEVLQQLERKLATVLDSDNSIEAINRRKSLRVSTTMAVKLESAGQLQKTYIKNISGGGLFVETDQMRPLGTKIDLELVLPDDPQPLKLSCEVSWASPKAVGDLKPGLGLKFLQLSDKAEVRIRRIISKGVETQLNNKLKNEKKK